MLNVCEVFGCHGCPFFYECYYAEFKEGFDNIHTCDEWLSMINDKIHDLENAKKTIKSYKKLIDKN